MVNNDLYRLIIRPSASISKMQTGKFEYSFSNDSYPPRSLTSYVFDRFVKKK